MSNDFDVLIKNVTIVDGTGKPPYKGSIGIKGEKISTLGDVKGDAVEVLDRPGLTATPGFIDAHSHADRNILMYPNCESSILQGITTFVGGQCGNSQAPLGDLVRVPNYIGDYLRKNHPYKYYPEQSLYPLDEINEWMKEKFGWTIDWRTMAGFFKRVEKEGISMNYAPLVGHGNTRYMVMGLDYKRHATQREVDEIIEHIHKAMDEGCIGLSTGLDYDPGFFASQNELIQCVRSLKEYGGIHCTHWRKTGRRQDVKPTTPKYPRIQGIIDSIDICKKTGVPLQIAHIKDGYEVFPTPPLRLQRGIAEATLDTVDEAITEGLPVTFDWQLIYESKLKLLPYLSSLFTPWVRETGSFERFSEFLKMEDYREDIREALFAGKWFIKQVSPVSNPYWAEEITIWKHANSNYEKRTLAEIALMKNRDKLDTLFDLIIEDPFSMGGRFYCYMVWEEVFLKHPKVSVCLDGSFEDSEYKKKQPPFSFPKSGSFDRFVTMINRYAGEGKLLTLEEAIKKMTENAAKPHNLKDRGILKTHYYADIVLLDIPNLKAMSSNTDPRKHPQGIEYVFVNGKKVVENGKHTGKRPGKILKRI